MSTPTTNPKRSGRRSGTSGTREAILLAASEAFARHGYDRTSVRSIASAAGVSHKLIAYFFGSKQRLFVAAIGLPLNPAEVLPPILAGDRDTLGERIATLVTQVLEHPEIHQRFTAVVRAAASDPTTARMVHEFLTKELFPRAASALGGDDATLRLNLAWSQMVGLITARYIVFIEPLASLPSDQAAWTITRTIERYLTEPLDPSKHGAPAVAP